VIVASTPRGADPDFVRFWREDATQMYVFETVAAASEGGPGASGDAESDD
jgi:hypothetical protein